MTLDALRSELVAAARAMNASGINQGTSGNLSARIPGGMLITPSAVPYDEMAALHVVAMGLDGQVHGRLAPSTEWRLHAGILEARPDQHAVLHAHPVAASALSTLRRDIPPFHYMVAVAGGDVIRCAPYATFGTPELAELALEALDGRRACLLANHGLVTLGQTPKDALRIAVEVEALARMYITALAVGEPAHLTAAEMAEVLAGFRGYGSTGRAR